MQSSNKTPKKMTIILGDNATLYGNHKNNLANKPRSYWVRQVLTLLALHLIPLPDAHTMHIFLLLSGIVSGKCLSTSLAVAN